VKPKHDIAPGFIIVLDLTFDIVVIEGVLSYIILDVELGKFDPPLWHAPYGCIV